MFARERSQQYFKGKQQFVGLQAVLSLIYFGQLIVQGKSQTDYSFQQLNLSSDEIDKIYKKKKNKKITDLMTLMYGTEERDFLLSLLEDNRSAYIKECLDYFPKN